MTRTSSRGEQTRLDLAEDGPSALLRPVGDWDFSNASDLWRTLVEICGRRPQQLDVDLGHARLLDMSCAGLLVGAAHRTRSEGRRFRVINARPHIERIFTLTQLEDVLAGRGRRAQSGRRRTGGPSTAKFEIRVSSAEG